MTLAARVHLTRKKEFHTVGPVYMVAMKYAIGNEVPHDHEFHELVFVRGGIGEHITGDGAYRIARGDVFVIVPGAAHTYRGLENLDIVNFLFIPDELPGFLLLPEAETLCESTPGMPFVVLPSEYMGPVEELVLEIHHEQERRASGWEYFVRTAFLRLIGLLCRCRAEVRQAPSRENRKIMNLLRYLHRNHAAALRLGDLAQLCGISESSLVRRFRQVTGNSLTEYVINLRLENGAAMLRNSDEHVSEIALRVGFQDGNYFSRMFRRKFELSPRAYRNYFRSGQAS